jgi:hypothetical protein
MNSSRMAAIATMMATLALGACGGGGGDSPAPAPVPTPAPSPAPAVTAGIFSVDYGQFSGIYTFVDGNRFSGVHFVDGIGLAGHPHAALAATNSVSERESIAWANFIDDAAEVGAQEPHGVFGRSFDGSGVDVSITGSMGSFTGKATKQMLYGDGSGKTLYDNPVALSVAARSYTGYVRTVGIGQTRQALTSATIAATGHIDLAVADCAYAGTLVQHGSTGVYDAQVSASGAGCAFSGPLTGILTPMGFDGSKASWALQLDTADNAQTAVFILDPA